MAEAPGPLSAYRLVRVTAAYLTPYRDIRLAALIDSPRAFASTWAREAYFDEATWLERAVRTPSWLAFDGERPAGTVTLWRDPERPEGEVHLVGMWVATVARGTGLADLLVRTAADAAREMGYTRLSLDVADENLPARRCYERNGFTPTGEVGTMPWDDTVTERMLAVDLVPPPRDPPDGMRELGHD